METLDQIISEPIHQVFRRAFIKRRSATTGLYESNWYEITDFVKSWGTFKISLDDQRLNRFTYSGISLRLNNSNGEFGNEKTPASLWYGYLTRYRSLVKIEAGYYDSSRNEYPTDSTQGIFISDTELNETPGSADVAFNCKGILSPFIETKASEITGIANGSQTASEIIGKIRDATDGSGNFLFRNFITSTAWSIQSTTTIYTQFNTTTILDDFTVWELMNKFAESENFVIYPTKMGGLNFEDRQPNTSSSQFSFRGGKFNRPNVITVNYVKENTNNLYTSIRVKFLPDDTTTSFIEVGATTLVNNSNTAWKYGRRVYEFENLFMNTLTANLVASKLANEFGNLKLETEMNCLFIPHLDILDRVDVSYREVDLTNAELWDFENWASDTASSPTDGLSWDAESGTTVEWAQKNFKILSKETNLDTFITKFILRESEV